MLISLVEIFYSVFLGVYLLACAIFIVCLFEMKIKNSGEFLALAAFAFLDLLMTLLIFKGLPNELEAYHLFPFAGFLWVTGFYVYYRILERIFEFESSISTTIKFFSKTMIMLLGCLAFFFGIEDLREAFISTSGHGHEVLFINSTLSLWGLGCIAFAGACVVAGNLHAFIVIARSKGRMAQKLLFYGSALSLSIAVNDTLVVVGASDFLPLTFLSYFPALTYFLFRCFSLLQESSESGETYKLASLLGEREEKPRENRVLLKGILVHIVSHLKEKRPEVRAKVEFAFTDQFYLHGEKPEMVVLFYNLLEKVFESMAEDDYPQGRQGIVKIACERFERTLVRIQHSGPALKFANDLEDMGIFKVEKAILDKISGSMRFMRENDMNVFEIEFRS